MLTALCASGVERTAGYLKMIRAIQLHMLAVMQANTGHNTSTKRGAEIRRSIEGRARVVLRLPPGGVGSTRRPVRLHVLRRGGRTTSASVPEFLSSKDVLEIDNGAVSVIELLAAFLP